MGAAAKQNGRAGGHAKLPQQRRHIQHSAFIEFGGVELQIADDANGPKAATQRAQSFGVGVVLATHADKGPKQGSKQKTESFVAAVGFFGQARVDEKSGNILPTRAPEKVGPDFSFDQHNGVGVDMFDRAKSWFTP